MNGLVTLTNSEGPGIAFLPGRSRIHAYFNYHQRSLGFQNRKGTPPQGMNVFYGAD